MVGALNLALLPFLFSSSFGINDITPNPNISSSSIYYIEEKGGDENYKLNHNGDNISITSIMSSDELLIHRSITELLSCINNEDIEAGGSPSYLQFFLQLRNADYYEVVIKNLVVSGLTYKLALLNLFSSINYRDTLELERKIVVEALYSDQLILQEYALNVISIWGDYNFILQFENLQIKNYFLQERLQILISISKKL